MPAPTSCRRSDASRWSRRCSMRSTELGVRAAATALRAGEVSAAALVDACLDRIGSVDPTVKAWIHVDDTGARAAARAADAAVRPGATLGPLHGVPIGVKDIIDVAGMPTTAGARAFAHTRPTRDATCVARLRAAGAIVLGKTHTTQFAYRDAAPTTNPWNAAHTPGGSSSGSAAAVAARTVPVALGSQTVGSILRPAAYNGIVGLKGTNGLVPLDGVVPLGYSLDHVGPLTRSVEDAALVLGIMAGRALVPEAMETPRLAVARELFERAEPELRRHLDGVVDRLVKAGARIEEVRLPPSFAGLADAALVLLEVEAATYHAPAFAKYASEGSSTSRPIGRASASGTTSRRSSRSTTRSCRRRRRRPRRRAWPGRATPRSASHGRRSARRRSRCPPACRAPACPLRCSWRRRREATRGSSAPPCGVSASSVRRRPRP
ncbi:MAG: amidase [Candidatus Rokuibacteriota bacterium]|nr:MAG: amidase [Candidatus Rokubacteria bacterium]